VLVEFENSNTSKLKGVCVAVFIGIVQKVRQMFGVDTETFVQIILFQSSQKKYHQSSTKSSVFSNLNPTSRELRANLIYISTLDNQ
jgi:hypothetical protein